MQYKKILRIFSLLSLGILYSSTSPFEVFAQTATTSTPFASASATVSPTPIDPPENPINLTLSPITIQFDTKPGETQTAEIKIRNNSTQVEPLRVKFGTFGFNERTQQIDLNQNVETQEMSWISISEPEFIVNPSEWKSLTLSFSPPSDAALTYYYAVIFERSNEKLREDATTKLTGAPAILVLTNVSSTLTKRELKVDSFSVPKFWIEFLPQTFQLKVRNTGNLHLKPVGNIFIDGQGKQDLAVLTINEKGSLVLPNTSRDFEINWSDGFPVYQDKMEKESVVKDEDGKTVRELQWDFSTADRFRFGKYTAHLLLVYDNGERDIPIESYVSFWVIPWRICLAVLFVLLFVLLGVRSTLVSLFKKLRKK